MRIMGILEQGGVTIGPPVLEGAVATEHTSGTTRDVALPATISAGDLIVIMMAVAGAGGLTTCSAPGFTSLVPLPSDVGVLYKVAAGTEGGTNVTVTTNLSTVDTASVALVYSNVDTTVEGDIQLAAQASDATPDPPSITAGWGAANNLVTALYFSLEVNNVTGFPSNCTLNNQAFNSGNYGIGVACAETALATFNPSTFTLSAAESGYAISFILKGFP